MTDEGFRANVAALLKRAGYPSANITWSPLSGGRNNRTYRLVVSGEPVLMKRYYRGGGWDRLAAESRFLRFCEKAGIGRVPRLLAEDGENGIALHSWANGAKPEGARAAVADVMDTADFLRALADASCGVDMADIPPARDACLCFDDFFRSPRERLAELERALTENPGLPQVDEAKIFLRKAVAPFWERAREKAEKALSGFDLHSPFPAHRLMYSPSDIGLHNALRLRDGRLSFIDFEYAGRDCPLKAILDFFCQADYAPSLDGMPEFVERVFADSGMSDEAANIARELIPLNRVKFCCIALNEFKSRDAARRAFAGHGDTAPALQRQLRKAKHILGSSL